MSKFLLKHGVASAVVVTGSVVMTAVLYFALLLWAIVTNGGLGGPLALPGMVVMAFVAASAAVVLILLPVTEVTRILCARIQRFRWIAEIALATMILVVYVFAASFGFGLHRRVSVESVTQFGAITSAILLVLLGVYWWTVQATDVLLRLAQRCWRRTSGGAFARVLSAVLIRR